MKHNKYWNLPYQPAKAYEKKVAYFCMEYAIDQSLKIYSGGLGFLAGSHMRSAYELKQNMIGIGILWKYGYYDQGRNHDQTLHPHFVEKNYSFLQDTGIKIQVRIKNNSHVAVKVWYLAPEIFGTVPLYLLSTDLPENDYLSSTITHKLYDDNLPARIAQSIVLGIAGGKLVDLLGGADIYHINEGHALPLAFYLLNHKYKNIDELKKHFTFTTHTPEKAGNEEHEANLLNEMGFFEKTLSTDELKEVTKGEASLNYTLTALRMAKIANGVSKLHGEVSRKMWEENTGICKIISITNAQNKNYWTDKILLKSYEEDDLNAFQARKSELKRRLFKVVADQTGKIFDPKVLTIVWARRFAAYKRADLLLRDLKRFEKLIKNTKTPIQIIWAGKPYPLDYGAVGVFNHLVHFTKNIPNCAVLTGYELKLSGLLKKGADIWLNTPRRPREASGTSGMTASMNGTINLSVFDGWICEFMKPGVNGFTVDLVDEKLSLEKQDDLDCKHIYDVLENEIISLFYNEPEKWWNINKQNMKDVFDYFQTERMADEYYKLIYI